MRNRTDANRAGKHTPGGAGYAVPAQADLSVVLQRGLTKPFGQPQIVPAESPSNTLAAREDRLMPGEFTTQNNGIAWMSGLPSGALTGRGYVRQYAPRRRVLAVVVDSNSLCVQWVSDSHADLHAGVDVLLRCVDTAHAL